MRHIIYSNHSRGSVVNERFHVVNDHIDYILMKLFYETSFIHSFMASFMNL